MNSYIINIEAWPYHGVSQDDAAPRVRSFTVQANDFDEAYRYAKAMQLAIKSSDKVCKAPIKSIAQDKF